MGTASISTKGQVVIPQDLRDRYHLKPNTKAQWVDLGGPLLLAPRYEDPLRESRGLLSRSRLTQKALRSERRREKRKR